MNKSDYVLAYLYGKEKCINVDTRLFELHDPNVTIFSQMTKEEKKELLIGLIVEGLLTYSNHLYFVTRRGELRIQNIISEEGLGGLLLVKTYATLEVDILSNKCNEIVDTSTGNHISKIDLDIHPEYLWYMQYRVKIMTYKYYYRFIYMHNIRHNIIYDFGDVSGFALKCVTINSSIVVEDTETKEVMSYEVVEEHAGDINAGKISVKSSFGEAAIGTMAGDSFDVNGVTYKILQLN